jgi:hypothetical protein
LNHALIVTGAVVSLVLVASLVLAQERAVIPIPGEPAPAFPEDPRAPGPAREGKEVPAPAGGRIEPDSFVGDRFLAQGQRAAYEFEAQAGEFSLFELVTYGYERGWQSEAELTILDPAGKVLAVRRKGGGTVYRLVVPFTAPADGTYRIDLVAREQYFRYTIVRNVHLYPHEQGACYDLGSRSHVFDHLAEGTEEVRYALDVRAGEAIGLRVVPASPALRVPCRLERRAAIQGGEGADAVMAAEDPTAMRSGGGMRGGGGGSWTPVLDVRLDGEPLGPEGHYVSFVAPRAARVELLVRARSQKEGGIYELEIERSVPLQPVHGSVSDRDGDALAGRLVDFYREPELDLVATTTSGADGSYAAKVPAGDYTIRVRSTGEAPPTCVQAKIEADRELHLITGG